MNTETKEKGVIELAPESFRREPTISSLPAVQANTPMAMLAVAVQKGMDVATIEGLMKLQERWEANEARKEFDQAMTAFKSNPPEIHKNKQVSFDTSKGRTEYKHATLDEVSITIGKALAVHGLSHRWNIEQKESGIKVTCVVAHSKGHSEKVSLEAGADQSGGKNSIQAVGSTVTYLQRYTLLAATGMAVQDQDDDGADSGPRGLTDEAYQDFKKRIEATTTKPEAKKVWQEGVKACQACGDVVKANALKTCLLAHGDFLSSVEKQQP